MIWENFFRDKCKDIFTTSNHVIDIGEGLRAREATGNRFEKNNAWLQEYIEKVDYKVMDPVPDYAPDVVGDIHDMPFADNSIEGMFCMAVLEHVENPILAMQEMYRTLKPGGKLLIYVPFLYYYHAHPGYYKDFWRFTVDTIHYLAKPFSYMEYVHVRDRIEMLVRLTPVGRSDFMCNLAARLDKWINKKPKQQVGGFYVYLVK